MAEIDADALVDAVRKTGIPLKQGDMLAVRLPSATNARELDSAHRYACKIERATGIKVVFIPGEEFQHTTVNVTVNGFVGSETDLAERVSVLLGQRALEYRRRGNAAPLDLSIP